MIKFLIQRPIAVLMAFTACFIIGLVTYSTLPISLLPNIAIPEITVQVASANTSARELENTIVKPLRRPPVPSSGSSRWNLSAILETVVQPCSNWHTTRRSSRR